jgi:hypothetical protein
MGYEALREQTLARQKELGIVPGDTELPPLNPIGTPDTRTGPGGGRVVKSLGDGTLSVFDGPARAIRAAEAIRDDLDDLQLEVRSGVHTGECELVGDDVGGLAVHIGARIGAMAGAGEILVSSTVADLVVGSGMSFAERGEHELKGVPGLWKVLAVGDSAARPEPLRAAAIEREMTVSDRVTVGLARRAPGPLRAMAELGRRAGRRRPEAKPR